MAVKTFRVSPSLPLDRYLPVGIIRGLAAWRSPIRYRKRGALRLHCRPHFPQSTHLRLSFFALDIESDTRFPIGPLVPFLVDTSLGKTISRQAKAEAAELGLWVGKLEAHSNWRAASDSAASASQRFGTDATCRLEWRLFMGTYKQFSSCNEAPVTSAD
ncbi:hypothetical protein [Mesorhizobium comanense]|uniref:hypothetical protein n=1 Tax=Mesorhizobium comanense TaxID=2502215 RepID=UPI0010F964C6|nr:hypothetical protein [Mesorhizobium comanense]